MLDGGSLTMVVTTATVAADAQSAWDLSILTAIAEMVIAVSSC